MFVLQERPQAGRCQTADTRLDGSFEGQNHQIHMERKSGPDRQLRDIKGLLRKRGKALYISYRQQQFITYHMEL